MAQWAARVVLEPVGSLISNDNTTRFTAPFDDPVLAPVDGTVSDVRTCYLDGRHDDLRVEIRPDDAPELRVVMIHLDDLQVRVGEPVATGSTAIAGTARRFPFVSQIDDLTDPERWPHVHLESERESASRPGDG